MEGRDAIQYTLSTGLLLKREGGREKEGGREGGGREGREGGRGGGGRGGKGGGRGGGGGMQYTLSMGC